MYMNWYKKNLPSGFIYMVNKKDIKTIDDLTGNIIKAVFLEGTAYTESKIYKNWKFGKNVVYLTYQLNDNDLIVYIKLYGVKQSNFDNDEELISEKDRIKKDILENISKNIRSMINNEPIDKFHSINII